jgi:Family of unknown function (DUF5677)
MSDAHDQNFNEETKLLVAEIGEVAGRLGGGEVRESPRHHLEILALYDRCRSTFGAIALLAGQGFGQEAVSLGRSLFTESLMLAELAEADEPRRVELVIGWSIATIDDLEGVLREALADGDDFAEQLEGLTSIRAELEGYARRHDVGTQRWRPNEKALAQKHDRDGYGDFRLAHHFVHGSTFAVSQRYTKREDVVWIGGQARKGPWALPAVLFAAQSLVYAVRSTCTILGLEEPADLDELLNRIEDLGRRAGILT